MSRSRWGCLAAAKNAPHAAGVAPVLSASTAGTGGEVTPFATIWDNACKRKRSLAGDDVFPRAAFVDPAFTATLPERETLLGALDALSQALETLWNTTATSVSGAYALQALDLLLDALPGLTVHGTPLPAVRERLQPAALRAGVAISQSQTSLGHSMSYPLTLHFGVPHGRPAPPSWTG